MPDNAVETTIINALYGANFLSGAYAGSMTLKANTSLVDATITVFN